MRPAFMASNKEGTAMMKTISTRALEKRYEKILAMKQADKNRFRQNPLGEGYLTRNERYNELLWSIEPELRARGLTA
jgi:hypothetical protein